MKKKYMKNLLAGTLSAVMLCSTASAIYAEDSATGAASGGKVIYSSDFEDGDVSAFVNRGENDTTVISASTDNAVSGSTSLCASGRSSSWNGPAFRLDDKCEAGTAYLLSVKAMGKYYTNLTISMQYSDAGGNAHYENLQKLEGSGWQEVNDLKIMFSDDVSDVYVYFEGGSDDIYIDDFVIKEAASASIEQDIPSLKDLYSDYFKIGTATTVKELAPKTTKELILKHFNSITAGNELKPDAILDQKACQAMAAEGNDENPQVNLDSAKSILDFARDNNIPVRGHVLVWHQQTPEWFFKENYDPNGEWVSKEKMLVRLENYIKNVFDAVKAEYSDVNFYAWDVVNECFKDNGSSREPGFPDQSNGYQASPWVQIFGDNSFIKPAFEFAKKYAPEGTKLYYNDYNEYMDKKDAIIKLTEEINSDGHYIDGIGMQSHLDARSGSDAFPSVSMYKKALDQFCETGLDVQVTELDVTINDKDHFKEQAQYYSDIMDAIVEQKDKVSAVVFWGTTDDQSWRAENNPLLFNEDYTAKESFYSIIDGIESTGTTTTTTQTTTTTETITTQTTTALIPHYITFSFEDTITDITDETITFKENGEFKTYYPEMIEQFKSAGVGSNVSVKVQCHDGTHTIMVIDKIEVIGESNISYGDANEDGKVSLADAVLIMQALSNPDDYKLTAQGQLNADVVGNDGITPKDALAIQKVDLNLIKVEDFPLDNLDE